MSGVLFLKYTAVKTDNNFAADCNSSTVYTENSVCTTIQYCHSNTQAIHSLNCRLWQPSVWFTFSSCTFKSIFGFHGMGLNFVVIQNTLHPPRSKAYRGSTWYKFFLHSVHTVCVCRVHKNSHTPDKRIANFCFRHPFFMWGRIFWAHCPSNFANLHQTSRKNRLNPLQ